MTKSVPLICFVGVTASGKSFLANQLAKKGLPIESVSITSRAKRDDDGELSYKIFNVPIKEWDKNDEFLQSLINKTGKEGEQTAYGVRKEDLTHCLKRGKIPVCFPNVNDLESFFRKGLKLLFIVVKPPGKEVAEQFQSIKQRLKERSDFDQKQIEVRLTTAHKELDGLNSIDKQNFPEPVEIVSYTSNPDIPEIIEDLKNKILDFFYKNKKDKNSGNLAKRVPIWS